MKGYNDRLFDRKSIRGKLHYARFFWLEQKVKTYYPKAKSVMELGCFDAKTVDFLPKDLSTYRGYDSNWEGGLDMAIERFKEVGHYKFENCISLEDFSPPKSAFDITICMETLEHLPLKDLDAYIIKLFDATKHLCFVSVPNEKGIVLIIKYLVKKIVLRSVTEEYSYGDLFNAFFGRLHKVERNEGGHKGFDYSKLVSQLEEQFIVEEINGIPFRFLPRGLNFSIGIVLRKRRLSQ